MDLALSICRCGRKRSTIQGVVVDLIRTRLLNDLFPLFLEFRISFPRGLPNLIIYKIMLA